MASKGQQAPSNLGAKRWPLLLVDAVRCGRVAL
jgi:hypothetical protein